MIAMWMLYSTIVALVAGIAARLLEQAMILRGGATRWIWASSLAGSLLFVGAMYFRPIQHSVASTEAFVGSPVASTSAPAAAQHSLFDQLQIAARAADRPLTLFWLLGILAVAGYIGVAQASLVRRRARWRRTVVDGVTMYVSADVGPALVGLRAPEIVVPEWLLECDAAQRRLVVAHEEEHVRAHDPLLLASGLFLALLTPWNIPAWWQLRRLRFAIEVDCDKRVMRTHRDTRGYGELLLTVASRIAHTGPILLPATFSEPRSLLERRIEILAMRLPRFARTRAAVSASLAGVLIVAACFAPTPDKPGPTSPQADAVKSLPEAPVLTKFTVAPKLLNVAETSATMQAVYPALVRSTGSSGQTAVWIRVEQDGAVSDARVKQSSDVSSIDDAALRVARRMKFSPAMDANGAIPAWITMQIMFQPPPANAAEQSPTQTIAAGALKPTEAAPEFTPYTQQPELLNRPEIGASLNAGYPKLLREAGIEGTTQVWLHVDTNGAVDDARVKDTSGHMPLDYAALKVARVMKFAAAKNNMEPTAVWLVVPISFQREKPPAIR